MPNHCQNTLTIIGEKEKVQEFMEGIDEDKGWIKTYYPMPSILKNTRKPNADGKVVIMLHDEVTRNEDFIVLTEEQSSIFTSVHGHTNWYDWAVDNWGTKWGDYYQKYQYSEGLASIHFSTAWSPPIPALDVVSKKFPELQFILEYEEIGMMFGGKVVAINGIDTNEEWELEYDEETEEVARVY